MPHGLANFVSKLNHVRAGEISKLFDLQAVPARFAGAQFGRVDRQGLQLNADGGEDWYS